jgi:hypothetical protein
VIGLGYFIICYAVFSAETFILGKFKVKDTQFHCALLFLNLSNISGFDAVLKNEILNHSSEFNNIGNCQTGT